MKKILLTAGPIPARLDSVKFLTNRFKGGLALKTAERLQQLGHNVHLVCWQFADLQTNLPIIYVEDVLDYYQKVLSFEADAYILAAAVANLMPSNPYEGKFPSHKYQVGEKFNIEFEIAPRVIDQIKQKYPRATLIGYKLYDGATEQLIQAGQKTLYDAKANLIFANHPRWAKEKKIALTSDGSIFEVTFDQHIELIHQLIQQEWYTTKIISPSPIQITEEDQFILENYPKYQVGDFTFGSFAIRKDKSFLTTIRGKKEKDLTAIAWVQQVDQYRRVVYSDQKASLNAPLFAAIFELNPAIQYIIHGHDLIGELRHHQYEFPGTTGDLNNAVILEEDNQILQLKHHGYLACFENFEQCQQFLQCRT